MRPTEVTVTTWLMGVLNLLGYSLLLDVRRSRLGRGRLSSVHADDRSGLRGFMVLLARAQLGTNTCFCYLLFVLLQSSGLCLYEFPRENHAAG